ncbi:Bug family tripartite tricarboxylate transporter substrate binding protein [Muricoccus aerilatus]|uniref:Bug family tripartite tricarboxylate transporter substrate binding protein n=1 Tax=Muricoccus aerilatus TaxID=452982 RepID=UPI0006934593|nr:tripartite tricarboxylate transporter substrate binding protein [Roseomonas aerilata]
MGKDASSVAVGRPREQETRPPTASRRGVLRGASALAATLLPTSAHPQASWPSRPITIVVPFPPGGTLDTLARTLAEKLRASLGQPVVVENRTGAAGNVGASQVARAQPDGYTLLCAPQMSFNADLLYPDLNYDPRGFEPVSVLATYPNVIVGRQDLPFSTIPELLAAAGARPDGITYGSQGNGQIAHLTFKMLEAMTGIRMVHVPYRGSAPLLTALLSGEVDISADNLLLMNAQVAAGRLKLVAVTGSGRLSSFPAVPAVAEFVPGFVSDTWTAIGAPPRTPAEIRERLAVAIDQAVHTADFREKLLDVRAEPFGRTPEAMGTMVRESRERWAPVINSTGIRVE